MILRLFLLLSAILSCIVQVNAKMMFGCSLSPKQRLITNSPGSGWDNIRSIEKNLVFDRNHYDNCQYSSDLRYLHPDTVIVKRILKNNAYTQALYFESSGTFVDCLDRIIKMPNDFPFPGVSGYFSELKFNLTHPESESDFSLVEACVKVQKYRVTLKPGTKLHENFRNALIQIAFMVRSSHIKMSSIENMVHMEDYRAPVNFTASNSSDSYLYSIVKASYLADLLIRDFGTHAVTSFHLGGVISEVTKLQVLMSNLWEFGAVQSLFKRFRVPFSTENVLGYDEKMSRTGKWDFKTAVKYKEQLVVGRYNKFSSWHSDLQLYNEVIDQKGVMLNELVTQENLPRFSPIMLKKVQHIVKNAINRYYSANVVSGCMGKGNATWMRRANYEPSYVCQRTYMIKHVYGKIFGGAYMNCTGLFGYCGGYESKNPYTGQHSCPNGYSARPFLPSVETDCLAKDRNKAIYRGGKFKCAFKQPYWCFPESQDYKRTYYFGGMYSDHFINRATGKKSCPRDFSVLNLGPQLRVCFSVRDRHDLALMFGGLFTHYMENPIINLLPYKGGKIISKQCPPGFEAYSVATELDMPVHYCLHSIQFQNTDKNRVEQAPVLKLTQDDIFKEQYFREVAAYEGELDIVDSSMRNLMMNPLALIALAILLAIL